MWADVLTKPKKGAAFKKMRAQLTNCSVDYEEDKEREISLNIKLLTGRGTGPFLTPQECVGNDRKLQLVTDRQIGVSRILKQARPVLHRKGGE
jgi:hypothetical protein